MRVAEVRYYDKGATVASMTKQYGYTDPATGRTSGVLFDRPVFEKIYEHAGYTYTSPDDPLFSGIHSARQYEVFDTPINNNPYGNSSGVGYGYVTETVSYISGKTVSTFYNSPAEDVSFSYRVSNPLNGKMRSCSIYNSEGNIVKSSSYNYEYKYSHMYYGVNLSRNWEVFSDLVNPDATFWLECPHNQYVPSYYDNFYTILKYALNQCDITLKSKTETEDGMGYTTDFTYDDSTLLKKSESFLNSDGTTVRTTYSYPADFSFAPYSYLDSRHIISPIVEARVFRRDTLIDARLTTYDTEGIPEGIFFGAVTTSTSPTVAAFSNGVPNTTLYPVCNLRYGRKDSRGNPVLCIIGETDSILYIWGYRYRYPVARITGSEYEAVSAALGCSPESLSSATSPNFTAIEALRISLPTALVNTYHYNSHGNITEKEDPSGIMVDYGYDPYGRLASRSRTNVLPAQTTDSYSYDTTWISHSAYCNTDMSSAAKDIVYYDGLGLPQQEIFVGATTNGNSIVLPFIYDKALRSYRDYLPYALQTGSEERQGSPLTDQLSYWSGRYASETCPFLTIGYENAPTDRVSMVRRIGRAYYDANKTTATSRRTSTSGEVLKLKVNSSGTITASGYMTGLHVTETTDEDGLKTAVYRDVLGFNVLERKYLASGNTCDTYHVYDNFYNLAYVLPPEASSQLTSSGSWSESSALCRNYCYRYIHDSSRRIIASRLPGCDPEYLVYDKADRIIGRQNAKDRADTNWITYQFDESGRMASMRQWKSSISHSALRAAGTNATSNGIDVMRKHYDSYPSADSGSLSFSPISGVVTTSDLRTYVRGMDTQDDLCGISSTASASPSFEKRRNYYDAFGRIIQEVTLGIDGGVTRRSWKYDFRGNMVASDERTDGFAKTMMNTYDSRSRLLSATTYVNDSLCSTETYTYDDMGQMITSVHGNGLTESYAYDIRGWLTSHSATRNGNTLFNSGLGYFTGGVGGQSSYTGNIMTLSWRQGPESGKQYKFSYDLLGRLTESAMYIDSTYADGNSEKGVTYDRNGNILTLRRYVGSALSDDMSYTYSGNHRAGYLYDSMGDVTAVPAGGPVSSFNRLSLPDSVSEAGGDTTIYAYLVDGTKVSAINLEGRGYRYRGSLRFAADTGTVTFESTDFPGGRIVRDGRSYRLLYFTTDHIGSVRMITDGSGTVEERYDYLPFGTALDAGTSEPCGSKGDFLFSGKERQDDGRGLLDFGARMYDPSVMIWTSVDPLAEKYPFISPYAYCGNNPIRRIDPDGRKFTDAAWKQVNRLIDEINRRQAKDASSIAEKQAQIDAGDLSKKKSIKLQKQIDRLNNNTSELESTRGEIATLAASDQIYDIRSDNSMNIDGAVPGTGEYRSGAAFNYSNGNFEITLGDSSLGSLSHELKHAYQFETGTFSSGYKRDGVPFYDKADEWEAYSRGALFGGERIYTLPSLYDNLQNGPMDATKLAPIILSNPAELQKLADRNKSAFRVNGVTYIMQGRK
jgi:RHS repeat-associated core domain